MQQIWNERITLAEGWNEQQRDLVARAWWDATPGSTGTRCTEPGGTGTLRIALHVEEHGPYAPPLPLAGDALIFDTMPRREAAIRRVIAAIDAFLVAARPAAAAWAAECLARAEAREIADLLIPDLDD